MKHKYYFLLVLNMCLISLLLFFGFSDKSIFSTLETKQLIIRDGKNSGYMKLEMSSKQPNIRFYDKNEHLIANLGLEEGGYLYLSSSRSKSGIVLQTAPYPNIALVDKNKTQIVSLSLEGKKGAIDLKDNEGRSRVQLVMDDRPAIYLKGQEDQTLSSWTVLSDGGAGFGLADRQGMAASIIRGGLTPSITFYSPYANDPLAAIGMIKQVPHMMIAGQDKNEGILIHGGEPCGMMVVDEQGSLKILISKHGVFQKKGPEQKQLRKEKYFSFEEDSSILFPKR